MLNTNVVPGEHRSTQIQEDVYIYTYTNVLLGMSR